MNLLVLNEMRFLSEGFTAHVASKRLFTCMRSQMYLDIALVEEAPITDLASVHRFLLAD